MKAVWRWFHLWMSPKACFERCANWERYFAGIAVVLLGYGLYVGLFVAPPDALQGDAYRIIYVHVPAASLSLSLYAFLAVCACVGLVWRVKMAFWAIEAALPVGASITALALCTGMIWGKPMWGTYWVWDARLTAELILLFLYLGAMGLQSALDTHRQRNIILGVFLLIGAVDLPIVRYSVNWWHTLHQGSTLNLTQNSPIAPEMLTPLLASIFGFIAWAAWVVSLRLRVIIIERNPAAKWLKE